METDPNLGRQVLQAKAANLLYQHRRSQWLLDNGPCQMCGTWEELTIDHIDRATKHPKLRNADGNLQIFSWHEAAREEELAKCQVLCLEHHRYKSHCESLFDRDRTRAEHDVAEAFSAWRAANAANPASPETASAFNRLERAHETLDLLLAKGIAY